MEILRVAGCFGVWVLFVLCFLVLIVGGYYLRCCFVCFGLFFDLVKLIVLYVCVERCISLVVFLLLT